MPLSQYSSLRVGGPAWALAEPESSHELVQICTLARDHEIPTWIIGAGSNTIPHDRGFQGLIICTRKAEPTPKQIAPTIVEASCGVRLPRLARLCQELGLSGLEWSIGIPGTIGGAIWMNAGASGSDISTVLQDVSYWDGSGVRTVRREDVRWGDRCSSFQDHPSWLILRARLELRQSSPELVGRAIEERLKTVKETQPRSNPSVGTVFRANHRTLQMLAAGLQEGSIVCCQQNPAWINNLGDGTASEARCLVRRVMRRYLWRGLPMPKIEPIFVPYDLSSGVSPTVSFNHPSGAVRFVAQVSRCWGFLFRWRIAASRPPS